MLAKRTLSKTLYSTLQKVRSSIFKTQNLEAYHLIRIY